MQFSPQNRRDANRFLTTPRLCARARCAGECASALPRMLSAWPKRIPRYCDDYHRMEDKADPQASGLMRICPLEGNLNFSLMNQFSKYIWPSDSLTMSHLKILNKLWDRLTSFCRLKIGAGHSKSTKSSEKYIQAQIGSGWNGRVLIAENQSFFFSQR